MEALLPPLYALHAAHYEGAAPDRFRADLYEKDWILLLRETERGTPVGFSTQRLLEAEVDGQPTRAIFSGDTVIAREYWGTQELVRTWCRFAGAVKARFSDRPLYWFLISKGHRTYMYLPLFFHDFYPRHDRPTPPFEQRLLDTLAAGRYPEDYEPETGVIHHAGRFDRLRPELDAAPARLENPHVAFFLRCNPRYLEGDELACLARIEAENMRSVARRELEAGMRAEG